MSRDQEVLDEDDNIDVVDDSTCTSSITGCMGMGPELTTSLAPCSDFPKQQQEQQQYRENTSRTASATTANTANTHTGNSSNTPQRHPTLGTTSQHTEIEFYSTDDEEGESFENEETDDDEDDDDDDDNSSNVNFRPRHSGYSLQRAQSVQSIASDAFSLPVGSQDDVSSLECDNVDDQHDGDEVDDISLIEGENKLEGENNDSNEQEQQQRSMKPILVVSPVPTTPRSTVDPARLLAMFGSANKKSPMLQRSASSQRCLDLPEAVNEEDEHDDDDDNSVGFNDLLGASKKDNDGGDDNVDDLTLRLHRSLFIPRVAGPGQTTSPTTTTPVARTRKRLSGGGPSMMANEYDLLAKNLPPELDLKEARKYIAQLAEGVPDTPSTSAPATIRDNTTTCTSSPLERRRIPSTHRSVSKSSESEFTEEIIDEEDEDEDVPLDSRLPTTPQNHRLSRNSNAPRESFLSYDFTEVVEGSTDDDEEEIIEEIVEEEEDETEVIYEEKEEESDPSPTKLPGMVGTTS